MLLNRSLVERPREIKTALWLFVISSILDVIFVSYDKDYPGGISLLTLLFMYGIWRGAALAWHWSRVILYLSAATMALVLVFGISMFFTEPNWDIQRRIFLFAANSCLGFYALWLLNRPNSRSYFGLTCPSCGLQVARAKNLFFTRKECCNCGAQW